MSGRSSLRIRELKGILLERGYYTKNKKSPWTSWVHGPTCSLYLWMHPTTPPVVGTSSLRAGLLAHGSSCSRAFPGQLSPSGIKRLQYPFTAAGPLLILTGFPINPHWGARRVEYYFFFIKHCVAVLSIIFPVSSRPSAHQNCRGWAARFPTRNWPPMRDLRLKAFPISRSNLAPFDLQQCCRSPLDKIPVMRNDHVGNV